MVIGIVVGAVIASHKNNSMDGVPLRLVQRVTPENKVGDEFFVAVDAIGVATGEYVMISSGSTARQTTLTDNKPIDAIILAIVDEWQLNGRLVYQKSLPQLA